MGRVKALLVAIVLIGALLVAGDRVGAYEAEHIMSDKLASTYQLGQQPTVQIKGVPFLTQWASGNYGEVDVDLGSATAGGVQVSNVSAQLRDVSTKEFATSSQDIAGTRIGSLNVTGTVAYSSIPAPSGFQLSPNGNRLQLSGSYSVFGQSIPVTALIDVGVSAGRLQFSVAQVQASNSYVAELAKVAIDQQLQSRAFLQQLPMGVQLDSVTVAQDGLHVTGSGRQVTLPAKVSTGA